ncbi:uncharacterized protein LOC129749698 [Uranotaenia lowii]|uniref:uncharacterized protein LOC129749698 n=1 Tax=Uranotaenia lowii TaxID=190385 RepID=UPI0024797836|nr:uncharacterized protein LOC129749698 [Uranotaenia lowii]
MDEGENFPAARNVLEHDFYVDDAISGAATVEEAIELRDQLIALMKKGGFALRKICSNKPEVLRDLPIEMLGTNLTVTFEFSPNEAVKTLGISWDPCADELRFVNDIQPITEIWTRRQILSAIAKLFDPLGLIAPVIVSAKIIMQELALLQTGWDEPVPTHVNNKWKTFYEGLPHLKDLRLNRFAFAPLSKEVQLHCFADASQLAYGACVYARTVDFEGKICVSLLSAKSRVAPLKRLTLPRLELCAAKEAAILHYKIVKALDMESVRSVFWSDSTIVLNWLKAQPNTWQTFVANRVSCIQTHTYRHKWYHIAGKENPADLVSRGLPVADFLASRLWRNGPEW